MDYRLYHHRDLNAFECLGCRELIEIVNCAWLMIGGLKQRVRVKGNPENMQLFRELHEMDHEKCHLFKDHEKAKAAREFRKEGARRRLTGEGKDRAADRARAAYVLGSDGSGGTREPRPGQEATGRRGSSGSSALKPTASGFRSGPASGRSPG